MTGARKHGTRVKYSAEKCRCDECRRANSEYEKRRVRLNAYGRGALVDAGPSREHVRQVMSSRYPGAHDGLGRRRISELSGVSEGVISALLYGKYRGGRMVAVKKVRRETEERILAVDPDDLSAGAVVPAYPTRRMVEELLSSGVTKTRLARALGSTAKVPALQILQRPNVTVKTRRKVEELHWKVWRASKEFRFGCECPVPREVADSMKARESRAERMRRAGLTHAGPIHEGVA